MPLTDLLNRAPSTCDCPHYTPRSTRTACVDLLDLHACARPEYFLCNDPRSLSPNVLQRVSELPPPPASGRTPTTQPTMLDRVSSMQERVVDPPTPATNIAHGSGVEVLLRTEHGDVVVVNERTSADRLEVTFAEATAVHNLVSILGGSIVSIQRKTHGSPSLPTPAVASRTTTEANRDAQQLLFTPRQLKPNM